MSEVFIASSVHRWNDTRIFRKEAVSLAKRFSVEVHAPADFKEKTIDGVKITGLPVYRKRYLRPFNWARIFFRAILADSKVFHFHDPELIFAGFLVKAFTGKKVIYDVHEDYPLEIKSKYWIHKNLRDVTSRAFDFFEKKLSLHFYRIVTATESISARFLPEKVTVIKNFPEMKFYNGFETRKKDINNSTRVIPHRQIGNRNVCKHVRIQLGVRL